MLWIAVWIWRVALFSGLLLLCWEVLCVLVFWKVDFGRRVEKWGKSVGGVRLNAEMTLPVQGKGDLHLKGKGH